VKHHIRKQTIRIEVPSEALALSLQPRVGDFNRKYFLPAMEKLFDEFSVQGWRIRISRLELNLGVIPADRFEELAVERFNAELRRALEEALRRQHESPSPDNYSQPESASRLELFEYYLRYGTLPFWASSDGAVFSFEQLVVELAESDEAGLVQAIKRHAYQTNTLERIVLQLGEAMLRRLLHLLEPKYATLIITCLTDLRLIHRVEPVVALSENEFARSLWVLVLTYVVREPGSQFNRKTLVEWLLKGIARAEGFDYRRLVSELDLGLQKTVKRFPLESSLPAIVSEISHELNLVAKEAPHEVAPDSQTAVEFSSEESLTGESDLTHLVRIIREHGTEGRVIERLVFQFGEQTLERLVHLLEPASAASIIVFLKDMRALHQVEPVANVGSDEFSRTLWISTFTYLAHERGSQFNRKSFVKSLFEKIAESEGLDYTEIVAMAQFGLRRAGRNRPLESSLPAIIGELIAEFADDASTYDDVSQTLSDALAELESYLVEGRQATSDASALLRFVASHDVAGAQQLILRFVSGHEPGLVDRLLHLFSPADLLLVLAPEQKQFITGLAGVIRSVVLHVESAAPARSVVIDDIFWKTTLEYLLSDSSARWNRRAMVRQIVEAVAERVGTSPISLAGSLAETFEQTAGTVESSLVQAVDTSRDELSDRSRFTNHGPPAFARYDHVEFIRYYLCHGVLPPRALLRNPEMTAGSVLAFLPRLPHSLLYAVFTHESPNQQLQMIRRAVRTISEEDLIQLLRGLLTQAKEPNSPFQSALSATASRVEDKQEFYAQLLAAILSGRPLNLEELATSAAVSQPTTIEPVLAVDPAEPDVDKLTLMLEESPREAYSFVVKYAKDSRVREQWIKTLPESTLARITYLLEPRKYRILLDTAEVLASAWLEVAPPGCRAHGERQAFWIFLLEFLSQDADADRSVERLVAAFFQDVLTRYGAAAANTPDTMSVGTRMLECARRRAGMTGHVSLQAALRSQGKLLIAPWESSQQTTPASTETKAPKPRRTAFSMKVEEEDKSTGESISINNAGLVLTGPYLPHLFKSLNLLQTDENRPTSLPSGAAVSRAVHLLQYLVNGSTSTPEPLLVLNKILCGVAVSTPVDREIEPTEEERATCDRLLRAMIANWTIISNTSIAGLQETFLRRDGILQYREDGWKLRVQRKTVDVLVDQIPWTISVIYNSWMPQPFYVDW
jgi:hypothetical protein